MCVIITGKWLLDNKPVEKIVEKCPIVEKSEPKLEPKPAYPHHCPEYHNKRDFWRGYSDGCAGRVKVMDCPEYLEGYKIGLYDRGCKNHHYYDHYHPDGFSLNLPNFSLNIK